MSRIRLIVTACQGKRSLLYGTLVFHVTHGRYRVYTLLATSANGCPTCFGSQKCELDAWRVFVVVRFSTVGDVFCWNLHVIVTVLVVGGSVPDWTVLC